MAEAGTHGQLIEGGGVYSELWTGWYCLFAKYALHADSHSAQEASLDEADDSARNAHI